MKIIKLKLRKEIICYHICVLISYYKNFHFISKLNFPLKIYKKLFNLKL